MCFSSGSSKAPPPSQPTRFEYLPQGKSQQQKAALAGEQGKPSSYGSELGTAPAPTGAAANNEGAM